MRSVTLKIHYMAQRSVKYRFYSSLMYLCIYLIVVALPFDKFLDSNYHLLLVTIGKVILSSVMIIMFKREGFALEQFNPKRLVAFIPLLVLCGSNLVFLGVDHSNVVLEPNYLRLINSACFCLATALSEELIFRGMAINVIKSKFNRPLTLIISALVFGAVHFIAGVFSNPLGALIQAGYTLFLGLIVGFVYLYGGSIYAAVFIHFLFNFLNDGLFPLLYEGDWNATFYIVNISVGAAVAIYSAILLFIFERKKKEN